jgi:hypothetical protein
MTVSNGGQLLHCINVRKSWFCVHVFTRTARWNVWYKVLCKTKTNGHRKLVHASLHTDKIFITSCNIIYCDKQHFTLCSGVPKTFSSRKSPDKGNRLVAIAWQKTNSLRYIRRSLTNQDIILAPICHLGLITFTHLLQTAKYLHNEVLCQYMYWFSITQQA